MSPFEQMGLVGERPWGEVIALFPDGTAKLRIVNECFASSLHWHKQGDEVLCGKDDRGLWCPVEDMARAN